MSVNNGIALLTMAKKDFAALEGMIDDMTHFPDEIFGFHAEQAVEKAFKAWIAALGQTYPFTHDLSMLLNVLAKNGIAIDGWVDLLELGSFGVQFRYEEMAQDDEALDRKTVLSRVAGLIGAVETAMEKM